MISGKVAEEYRSLLQAANNLEGVLGAIGVYAVKRIFIGMSEIEGEEKALESARSAYNLLPRIHQESLMDGSIENVLPLFTLEQAKKLALIGFRAGLDDQEDCMDHYDISLEWEIPDRYGNDSDDEMEELRKWWADQDKVVVHYLKLGHEFNRCVS